MRKYDGWFGKEFNDEQFYKHRIKMGGTIYTSYYEEIAKKVRQLIRKDSQFESRLVEHIKHFMKMVDTYEAEFKKLRESKRKRELPKDFPGFPPDPRDWFILQRKLNTLHTRTRKNIILPPEQTKPPNEKEHLMCCYVRLLVIHDCLCRPPSYTPIYFKEANNVPVRYFEVSLEIWGHIIYTNLEIGTNIEKEAKDLADEALAEVTKNLEDLGLLPKINTQQAEQPTEANGGVSVKEPPLAVLKNPVTCREIGGIIHRRSDNIAAKLKKSGYPVVKSNRRYYCDAEHAGVVWPKWKKHWQNKQNQ